MKSSLDKLHEQVAAIDKDLLSTRSAKVPKELDENQKTIIDNFRAFDITRTSVFLSISENSQETPTAKKDQERNQTD